MGNTNENYSLIENSEDNRKLLKGKNQCTKSYNGIKKRLTDRTPVNLTEAEIKGRDNRPLPKE